jgi:hypothetical protein
MNIYQTRNLPAHQLLCPDAQSTDPVDTKTHAMLDVHCTTETCYNTQISWRAVHCNESGLHSLVGDKDYDWQDLRDSY